MIWNLHRRSPPDCFYAVSVNSCGTRKNRRATAFLDFSDRCANKRSLHLPPAAVACVARHARASFQEFYAQPKNTGTAKRCLYFLAGAEGLGVCCSVALHTYGSATEILRISVPASPLFAKNSSPNCFLNAQTLSGSSPLTVLLKQKAAA